MHSAAALRRAVDRLDAGLGGRRFAGRAQWIGDEGLCVVSDIDDTIKHTQVRQRREMLLNTFAREFTAVPGMAAWTRRRGRAADPAPPSTTSPARRCN